MKIHKDRFHYYVMKFTIQDKQKCSHFIQLLQNMKAFSEHILLHFDNERLYVQGMDSSHVSVYELKLNSSWFDEYDVTESVEIGINITLIHKILNTRNDEHSIHMTQNNDSLQVEFKTDSPKGFDKFFEIPIFDIDQEQLTIPEVEYDIEFSMESKKVKNLIDELSKFGESVQFTFENDRIKAMCSTEHEGKMEVHIDTNELESCSVNEEANINFSFNIKYIHHMCQFHKIGSEAQLFFSSEMPMQLRYDIDGEDNYIRFFLAPKVED